MPDMEPDDVEAVELAARGFAQEQYGAHLKLTGRVYNLIGRWKSSVKMRPFAEVSLAERVCVALHNRLANDLRGVQELAMRGYPLQAASLAASMFEGAYSLAFIGADENLAQEWVEHGDPARMFRPVKTLVRGVMQKERVPDIEASTKVKYRDYQQLCMAKHINPLLQKQHGISQRNLSEDRTVIVFSMGPDVKSETAVRTAWFALEQASILSLMAFSAYLREIVGKDALPSHVVAEIAELAQRCDDLHKSSIQRWGDEDPFPGKW